MNLRESDKQKYIIEINELKYAIDADKKNMKMKLIIKLNI